MTDPRSFRILVADDNDHVRHILKRSLEREGVVSRGAAFDLVEAENGEDAWRHLEETDFDLVVLDYYMPAMDGGTLLGLIRASARHATVPVLAVSGEVDRREPSLAGGADAFLSKPLRLVDVADAIRSLLKL